MSVREWKSIKKRAMKEKSKGVSMPQYHTESAPITPPVSSDMKCRGGIGLLQVRQCPASTR
jgi:hypothetical protein